MGHHVSQTRELNVKFEIGAISHLLLLMSTNLRAFRKAQKHVTIHISSEFKLLPFI